MTEDIKNIDKCLLHITVKSNTIKDNIIKIVSEAIDREMADLVDGLRDANLSIYNLKEQTNEKEEEV